MPESETKPRAGQIYAWRGQEEPRERFRVKSIRSGIVILRVLDPAPGQTNLTRSVGLGKLAAEYDLIQAPSRPWTDARVPGHTLRSEGAAFEPDAVGTRRVMGSWTGSALCSCGELSPVYTSNYQRKQWHRDQHKPAVVAATEASR